MKINRLRCGRFMGYVFCLAFLCLAWLSFSQDVYAETDYQITEVQMQGTITTDSSLNVRSGPGRDYDVIAKVNRDVTLTITGEADNGWYQVQVDGKTGFVSGEYVNAAPMQTEEPEELEREEGEPEEGYRGFRQSPFVIKLAAIGAVIVVILIMLAVTLKGIRRDEDDGDYDDDGEDEDDEDYGADEDDGDEEYDGGYEDGWEDDYDEDGYGGEETERQAPGRRSGRRRKAEREVTAEEASGRNGAQTKRKEYVLREEDYRVQIDPSFFEDREPIEQPAMVTGYLERKKIEEAEARAREQEEEAGKQKELDEAMAKLSELQKEIERLKNQ